MIESIVHATNGKLLPSKAIPAGMIGGLVTAQRC